VVGEVAGQPERNSGPVEGLGKDRLTHQTWRTMFLRHAPHARMGRGLRSKEARGRWAQLKKTAAGTGTEGTENKKPPRRETGRQRGADPEEPQRGG